MTKNTGWYGTESPDGRMVYFSKDHEDLGIWRVAIEGGEEVQITGPIARRTSFTVGKSGIYYITRTRPSKIRLHRFLDGKELDLFTLDKEPAWGIDVSSDERRILFSQFDVRNSDIMLIDNFR